MSDNSNSTLSYSPTATEIAIWKLRQFYLTRINGLPFYNTATDQDGLIPEPKNTPTNWRGSWGHDDGVLIVCLENGDLLFLSTSDPPTGKLKELLCDLCPNSSNLRVPYFKEEEPYKDGVYRRFGDPFSAI